MDGPRRRETKILLGFWHPSRCHQCKWRTSIQNLNHLTNAKRTCITVLGLGRVFIPIKTRRLTIRYTTWFQWFWFSQLIIIHSIPKIFSLYHFIIIIRSIPNPGIWSILSDSIPNHYTTSLVVPRLFGAPERFLLQVPGASAVAMAQVPLTLRSGCGRVALRGGQRRGLARRKFHGREMAMYQSFNYIFLW